jgi:hypothetical protein
MLNEFLQWAVLAFMAIFVFGLTRQLGKFLVPHREQAALHFGPDIGARLPKRVLDSNEQQGLLELMQARAAEWAVLLVVSDDCPACEGLLRGVPSSTTIQRAPLVVLARRSNAVHEKSLRAVADMVIVDGDRLKAAGLTATPFAMIVDRSLKVVHKALAFNLEEVVSQWGGASAPPAPVLERSEIDVRTYDEATVGHNLDLEIGDRQ